MICTLEMFLGLLAISTECNKLFGCSFTCHFQKFHASFLRVVPPTGLHSAAKDTTCDRSQDPRHHARGQDSPSPRLQRNRRSRQLCRHDKPAGNPRLSSGRHCKGSLRPGQGEGPLHQRPTAAHWGEQHHSSKPGLPGQPKACAWGDYGQGSAVVPKGDDIPGGGQRGGEAAQRYDHGILW